MINFRLFAVAATVSTMLAAPAVAGHLFTQGNTNTPVWIQQSQAVYVEQFYSDEYDEDPGDFLIYFDSDPTFFANPANIPPDADTTDPEWFSWSPGDVVQVTIQTATGLRTWTAAYDQDVSCAYTFCGYGFNDTDGEDYLTGGDIPTFTAWGTFLPNLNTAIVTSGGGLDLAEINTLGSTGLESLAPYFYGANGTDDPAIAFALADINADNVLSQSEVGTFVWETSEDIFDDVETANNGTPSGVLNTFGILFTALQGNFALSGYRFADSSGFQMHGSGSGPVDQSSVCSPPNCGPNSPGITPTETLASIYRLSVIVDQGLRQAAQVMLGAAEQELDVNFSELGGFNKRGGLTVSTSGAAMQYRWAARAEGSFDRNSALGNTRNGTFVVAYGVTQDLDVGVFGNHNDLDLSFDGFGFDGNVTSFGAYLRKRPDDGIGMQWKASLGAAVGRADIRRATGIVGAEAGAGSADLQGRVASVELGYGTRMGDTLLTPYGRFTYSKMGRDGYTETSGAIVPVTYGEYEQKLSTLTLGVNAERHLAERVRIAGGIFVARDLSRSADDISGSAALAGLESFSFAAPGNINETRVGADVTVFYSVSDNSRIYARAGAQRAAHSDKPTHSLALGFETRF